MEIESLLQSVWNHEVTVEAAERAIAPHIRPMRTAWVEFADDSAIHNGMFLLDNTSLKEGSVVVVEDGDRVEIGVIVCIFSHVGGRSPRPSVTIRYALSELPLPTEEQGEMIKRLIQLAPAIANRELTKQRILFGVNEEAEPANVLYSDEYPADTLEDIPEEELPAEDTEEAIEETREPAEDTPESPEEEEPETQKSPDVEPEPEEKEVKIAKENIRTEVETPEEETSPAEDKSSPIESEY